MPCLSSRREVSHMKAAFIYNFIDKTICNLLQFLSSFFKKNGSEKGFLVQQHTFDLNASKINKQRHFFNTTLNTSSP